MISVFGITEFGGPVFIHMFRGLLYGSYQKPKELVWLFGCFLLFLLMAEGFLGYVLPWGQMSYWAANVILSLFGAIPFIGPDLQIWIQGDFVIQSQQAARLRNKVWEHGGNGEEALQKAFKTKTIRQLHQLQRELLGGKNKD